MSKLSLMDLDDFTLENVVKALPIADQCNVARSCDYFKEVCLGIWRRNVIYHDTIKYGKESLCFEDYKYFICNLAEHLTTLALRTTDITAFGEAIKDVTLPKLTALRLDRIYSDRCLKPIKFFPKFINLKEILLVQPLLEFYLDDILGIQSLKHLEVIRYFGDFDVVAEKVIKAKENSIVKLLCEVGPYAPCWLTSERSFSNLEELALQTHYVRWSLHSTLYPIMHKLKVLHLLRWDYCEHEMVKFMHKCPNLERVILYEPTGTDDILSTNCEEITCNLFRHDNNIVEFRKDTCHTAFDIPKPRDSLCYNRNDFYFK